MAKEKDPAEIVETIAQSIRVSQRGARKVRAHRFRIEQLMGEAGIEVRPPSRTRGATTGWSCRCRCKCRSWRPVLTRHRQRNGSRTWHRSRQTA